MESYTRQTFKDGSTVLKAEHLNHMEDGIANATTIPNVPLDGTEQELTSLLIGESKEEVVTRALDMAYGTYNSGNSTFGLDQKLRAWVIVDAKVGDIISLVDKTSPYQFLVFKLVDGTTTYESTIREYFATDWVSDKKQRVIVVAKNANNDTLICSPDELLDIVSLTTTETTKNLYKIGSAETLQKEFDLSRCDFGKEMATGINYYVDGDVIVCKCTVSDLTNSVVKIFTAVGSGVARGSAYFVNFATGVMGMYGGIASTSSTLTVKYQKSIGFTLTAGHEYVIECMKKAKEHTIKITDTYSLESDTYTVMPTGSSDIGEHWGKRSYTVAGSVEVNSFKNYSLQPYNCRLLIIGDSFIEGATGFTNHANRYCARMKRLLYGSCSMCGFGGATTEQVSAFYEAYCKTLFKPDYVLIACGTNNKTYSTWLTAQKALIASIKAAGSTPILVTITRRLDSDNLSFMKQANDWIRNESNEMYIDINRITTLNYDGETQNTSMFATDKVHPLPETHELIIKKALLDIPEVFNLSSSYIKNRGNSGAI